MHVNTSYLHIEDQRWKQLIDHTPLVLLTENVLLIKKYTDLFRQYLPVDENFKSLEVGCGTGLWMWYFRSVFSYDIFGIDILESSIELSHKTLQYHQVADYTLLHKDLFSYNNPHYFDFVYNFGTIEHFKNPVKFLRHCDALLKKGGYMLIEVPHFSSINKFIMRIFHKKSYYRNYLNIHNQEIVSLKKFTKFIKDNLNGSYDIIYLDVAGCFDITLYNIPKLNDHYLEVEEKIFKMRKLIEFFNIESMAPGLLFIGKKRTD
jgi:2-polyprenyl-3-methyl-5-hydroxy-6-metoxy-1,4-benzoquinol methylase